MKAFLDTSVLVATFYGDHEHHASSLDLFLRFGKSATCCASHSLAEVYATLTRMPGKHRVSGDTALLFLADVREHLTLISLDGDEYYRALYTCNTKDFLRLTPTVAERVTRPDRA